MFELIKEWLAQRATNFVRISGKVARMSKGHAEKTLARTYHQLYYKYDKGYKALDKLHYLCNNSLKQNNRRFVVDWRAVPIENDNDRETWELSCTNLAVPDRKKILFSVNARKENR